MRPVRQTILHDPKNGMYGNCVQATIASLMELKIEEVPHFCDGPNPKNWNKSLNEWLRSFGLSYFMVNPDINWRTSFPGVNNLYHEIFGPSPRDPINTYHSVVGCNGKIVFDPHPSDDGLSGSIEDWTYGFLVKINN